MATKKDTRIPVKIRIELPDEKYGDYETRINHDNCIFAIFQGMIFLCMDDLGDYIEEHHPALWNNTKKHFATSSQWFERWHKQVVINLRNGEEGWKIYRQYFAQCYHDMSMTIFQIENKLAQLFGKAGYAEPYVMGKASIPIIMSALLRYKYMDLLDFAEKYMFENVDFYPKVNDEYHNAVIREKTKVMSHRGASKLIAQNVWSRAEPIIYQATKFNGKSEEDTKNVLEQSAAKQDNYIYGIADVFTNKMNAIVNDDLFKKCFEIINKEKNDKD